MNPINAEKTMIINSPYFWLIIFIILLVISIIWFVYPYYKKLIFGKTEEVVIEEETDIELDVQEQEIVLVRDYCSFCGAPNEYLREDESYRCSFCGKKLNEYEDEFSFEFIGVD
ncbi:MAG: hypothetical protein FK731_07210 [Asgard group archaeon]|nr:hypothetical protein [Asgard group archaeon]